MKLIIKIVLPLLCSGSFFLSGQTNYDWTFYNSSNSPLPENTVRCMTMDSNGDYWFGTDLGLTFFDGASWTTYNTSNSPLTDNSIRALEFDASGKLWIGTTQSGIFTFDLTSWSFFNPSNSELPDYFIRSIKKDLTGAMWVGTVEGLARYDAGSWTVWTISGNGLNSNNISCFGVDSNNRKYIGSINGGLMVYENDVITEYTLLEGGIPDNSSIGIVFDSNTNPWIASPSGGLFTADHSQIITQAIPDWTSYNMYNSAIPTNSLTSILIDQDNSFLMGSTEHGLIRFTLPDTWEIVDTANSVLPDNHILCLMQDPEGYIWIGTSMAGIVKIKKNTQSLAENQQGEMTVYPNPTNGLLQLRFAEPVSEFTLQISSTEGRILREFKGYTSETEVSIDIHELPSGQYFLRLLSNESVSVHPVIRK